MNLSRWLWKNPVIVKELRTRMRGGKAFWLVSIHLLVLTIFLGLAYLTLNSALSSPGNLEGRRYLGKAIFGLMVGLELIMISFTAPALTSGMVSSEKERQTYDLLRVTLLPPQAFVAGKYLSGLIFVCLLLLTSLPLQGPAFMIGGISPQEILIAIMILMVTAVAFCAFGIFFSALFRRTLASTVTTYAISIMLVFGIPMLSLVILAISSSALPRILDQLSPLPLGLLIGLGWSIVSLTPLASMIATEFIYLEQQSFWLATLTLQQNTKVTLVSPWVIYVLFYMIVSALLLWGSVRLIQRRD